MRREREEGGRKRNEAEIALKTMAPNRMIFTGCQIGDYCQVGEKRETEEGWRERLVHTHSHYHVYISNLRETKTLR